MTVGGLHIQAPLARRSRASSSGLPAGRRAGAPVRISPAGPGSAPRYRRSIAANDEARGSPGPLSVSRRYGRRYRVVLVRDPLLILRRRLRRPDIERPESRQLVRDILADDPRAVIRTSGRASRRRSGPDLSGRSRLSAQVSALDRCKR